MGKRRKKRVEDWQKETFHRHFKDSDEMCAYLAEKTGDTAVLSFSRGKDSIGAWLQMRRYFKRIIPYYLYRIPGLQLTKDSLKYFEDFFGTPIVTAPHPALMRQLDARVFQPPWRMKVLDQAEFMRDLEYDDIANWVARKHEVPWAFTATGVRAADNPVRAHSIKKNGPLNPKRRQFYPIYDWKNDRLLSELTASKVKLPVDYYLWGRTFDGIDYRFMEPLSRVYPEDYERVRFWFPLVDLELYTRKWARNQEDAA